MMLIDMQDPDTPTIFRKTLQRNVFREKLSHRIPKQFAQIPSNVVNESRQYFYQLESASPSMLGRPGPNVFEANTTTVEDTYTWLGNR